MEFTATEINRASQRTQTRVDTLREFTSSSSNQFIDNVVEALADHDNGLINGYEFATLVRYWHKRYIRTLSDMPKS